MIKDINANEIYNLMDFKDFINKNHLRIYRGRIVNVAFDECMRIIAVRNNNEDAYYTAVSRGCTTPYILFGYQISPELIEQHNNLLEKSLSSKKAG